MKNYLFLPMAVTIAISSSGFATQPSESNNIISFNNKSAYTLMLNSASTEKHGYCVDNDGKEQGCKSYLLPNGTQKIYVNQGGINLNYFINAPTVNNYNLNIQNFGATTFSATQIIDTNTVLANNNLDFNYIGKIITPSKIFKDVPFRGINLSGAEAGATLQQFWIPGIIDENYFINAGMNTVRYPIRWEYVCSDAPNCTIPNQMYLDIIKANVEHMLINHVNVVLDLHNYMRYFGQSSTTGDGSGKLVTKEQLVDVWSRLSNEFHDLAITYNGKNTPNQLIFEIMNEPEHMPTQDVLDYSNAVIAEIRNHSLKNLILIEGNSWSGLHSWDETGSATDNKSNAQVLIKNNIKDPQDNYALAIHQYFDSDGSGTQPTCQPLDNFKNYTKLNQFLAWITEQKVRFFLSEFGSGNDNNCITDVNWLLGELHKNEYFIGWTAWVAGHGWSMNNFNNLTPIDGKEQIQMTNIYANFLK